MAAPYSDSERRIEPRPGVQEKGQDSPRCYVRIRTPETFITRTRWVAVFFLHNQQNLEISFSDLRVIISQLRPRKPQKSSTSACIHT